MRVARYSPATAEDLFDFWSYISADDARAADAFVDRLQNTCQFLATSPGAGRRRPDLGAVVHSFAVGSYVIFYEPAAEGVHILRILHGARDVPSLFGGL